MDLHFNHPGGLNGRFEQILSQFLLKSLHIILDSRVPSMQSHPGGGEVKKSDKWFNLVLGDRPSTLDNLNLWHRNLMDPMIIDIILVQDQDKLDLSSSSASCLGTFTETVIERWLVRYECLRTSVPQVNDSSYKKTYKKTIILLRSLYSMMRLLPAYKAFGKLSSSFQTREFDIVYKVSTFTAPLSRTERSSMKQYSFVPVEAHQGRFSISVSYREDLSNFNLEAPASFPPEIITDYVGSPLADPLRAFPASFRSISMVSKGMQSPSSSSGTFQRPHSWSSGVHRALSLPQPQPFAGSPPSICRTPYEHSSAPSDMFGQRMQSYKLSSAHRKSTSGDEYQLSPPFSPSPSQSPPTYGNSLQARVQSETAPVSIPFSMVSRSLRNLSPNLSDPNKHSLPPLSPRFTKNDSSSGESPSGIRSYKRPDSLKSGESSYGITNIGPKISRDSKDDSGRSSGLISSSDSPHVGFSRSSSRLSFQDDLDECDFSCPFIVDDVDSSYPSASQDRDSVKGSDASLQAVSVGRKQDATVGALVHLLKTAPPLGQDSSGYRSSSEFMNSQVDGGGGRGGGGGGGGGNCASLGFSIPRKTLDGALEELNGYINLKESLLAKSPRHKVVSHGEALVL